MPAAVQVMGCREPYLLSVQGRRGGEQELVEAVTDEEEDELALQEAREALAVFAAMVRECREAIKNRRSANAVKSMKKARAGGEPTPEELAEMVEEDG